MPPQEANEYETHYQIERRVRGRNSSLNKQGKAHNLKGISCHRNQPSQTVLGGLQRFESIDPRHNSSLAHKLAIHTLYCITPPSGRGACGSIAMYSKLCPSGSLK